jgi:hypothetical protein
MAIISMMIVCHSNNVIAQVFSNDAGSREKLFIYEVKQIDEFFERFNDAPESFIRGIYKQKNKAFTISREKLIRSLFNYETSTWSKDSIDSFITSIINSDKPELLEFSDADWFAEANCKFQTQSGIVKIPIVLRTLKDKKSGFKWIITAVGHTPFVGSKITPVAASGNVGFINPASHGNNFIALGKALDDKKNLAGYFDDSFFSKQNASEFYSAISSGAIRFLYVTDVKYHFLQIDNWIFSVEYFGRKSLNSGWLVNRLSKASKMEKETYRKALLRNSPTKYFKP